MTSRHALLSSGMARADGLLQMMIAQLDAMDGEPELVPRLAHPEYNEQYNPYVTARAAPHDPPGPELRGKRGRSRAAGVSSISDERQPHAGVLTAIRLDLRFPAGRWRLLTIRCRRFAGRRTEWPTSWPYRSGGYTAAKPDRIQRLSTGAL
jgi:hypothetical protein